MRDEKGFTLIEVIITLTIIGILLGIAAISARDWVDRYKVEGQTKQLYSDLMNARVSAMQRNRIFYVTLATNQYAVYEDNYSAATLTTTPDGDGILQTTKDRLVTQAATQYKLVLTPATFIASNPTISGFNFTANGLASFATATVDIQCQSTANPAYDCVEISLTRILMGKWNGTTSTCIAQ
jgi:type IV fimbrial biogenesis protein FimT